MLRIDASEVEAQHVRESESALLCLNLAIMRMLLKAHPELVEEAAQTLRETRCRILDYELGARWDREVRALTGEIPRLAPIINMPC